MTGCDTQGDQQSPQGEQATLITRVDENQNENTLLGVKKYSVHGEYWRGKTEHLSILGYDGCCVL